MVGERIKQARLAAGLSQRETAKLAGLSAMAISKFERNLVTPTSKTFARLASVLDTRIEFFFRTDDIALEEIRYCAPASLPRKQRVRVEADVLDWAQPFIELMSLYPKPPIPPFAVPPGVLDVIASGEDVEEAASAMRSAWLLGQDSIFSLHDALLEQGVLALETTGANNTRFSGLTARVGGYPVIVVGSDWTGDRQRFVLARELGRLVLAGRVEGPLSESVAIERFAGAFLVPADVVRREMGEQRRHVETRELYLLKHRYGLSMNDCLSRLRDLGLIRRSAAKEMIRLFTVNGWRVDEPGKPYATEEPRRFESLVLQAMSEEMISVSKAAKLMSLPMGRFRDRLSLKGKP